MWNRAHTAAEIGALAQGATPLNLLGFTSSIGTDLLPMRGVNATAYTRFPFTFTGAPDFNGRRLRTKYEDGFVAYLNGVEIAHSNAPAVPQWNKPATADRTCAAALVREPLEIPGSAALLAQVANVLAIQALNENVSGNELLILPELAKVRTTAGRFLPTATPVMANSTGVSSFVADTQFSVGHGWRNADSWLLCSC